MDKWRSGLCFWLRAQAIRLFGDDRQGSKGALWEVNQLVSASGQDIPNAISAGEMGYGNLDKAGLYRGAIVSWQPDVAGGPDVIRNTEAAGNGGLPSCWHRPRVFAPFPTQAKVGLGWGTQGKIPVHNLRCA